LQNNITEFWGGGNPRLQGMASPSRGLHNQRGMEGMEASKSDGRRQGRSGLGRAPTPLGLGNAAVASRTINPHETRIILCQKALYLSQRPGAIKRGKRIWSLLSAVNDPTMSDGRKIKCYTWDHSRSRDHCGKEGGGSNKGQGKRFRRLQLV